MKIDPYYERQRCSALTVFSGNKSKHNSAVIENVDFRDFRRYVFGTLGNEANIIIQYYLVLRCLSTDLKIHDLEWPSYVKFSLLRRALSEFILHTYCRAYL